MKKILLICALMMVALIGRATEYYWSGAALDANLGNTNNYVQADDYTTIPDVLPGSSDTVTVDDMVVPDLQMPAIGVSDAGLFTLSGSFDYSGTFVFNGEVRTTGGANILAGTFNGPVTFAWDSAGGNIRGGYFINTFTLGEASTIWDGIFAGPVTMNQNTVTYGGIFSNSVWGTGSEYGRIPLYGGTFLGAVALGATMTIGGGSFYSQVDNYGGTIHGGNFYGTSIITGTVEIIATSVDPDTSGSLGGTSSFSNNPYFMIGEGTSITGVTVYADTTCNNGTIGSGLYYGALTVAGNSAFVYDGSFYGAVYGADGGSTIAGGTYYSTVNFQGAIQAGTFYGFVDDSGDQYTGFAGNFYGGLSTTCLITGGNYYCNVASFVYGISGGNFYGTTNGDSTAVDVSVDSASIASGTFASNVSVTVENTANITGGEFYGPVTADGAGVQYAHFYSSLTLVNTACWLDGITVDGTLLNNVGGSQIQSGTYNGFVNGDSYTTFGDGTFNGGAINYGGYFNGGTYNGFVSAMNGSLVLGGFFNAGLGIDFGSQAYAVGTLIVTSNLVLGSSGYTLGSGGGAAPDLSGVTSVTFPGGAEMRPQSGWPSSGGGGINGSSILGMQ